MKMKGLIATLGLGALAIAGVACGSAAASTDDTNAPAAPNPMTTIASVETNRQPATLEYLGAPAQISASLQQQSENQQTGIWVTGQGVLVLDPDLAVLNVGVEAMADTVAEARGQAADAMDAIVAALKARGIENSDIQTQYFSIYPRYEWMEVFEEGYRGGKQVLVGYTVSNSASVKIRDLEAVGEIIDDVANAGGDATRINGIYFTVEDPQQFMAELREIAVNDAIAKAQQFADLTGVELGRLTFIAELGGSAPVVKQLAAPQAAGLAFDAASTPISGGESTLMLTVQAGFAIQ